MGEIVTKRRGVMMIRCEPHTPNSTKMGLDAWMRPMTSLERYNYAKADLKAYDDRYGNRFLGDESDKAKRYEKRRAKLADTISNAYYDCVQEMGEKFNEAFDRGGPPNVS